MYLAFNLQVLYTESLLLKSTTIIYIFLLKIALQGQELFSRYAFYSLYCLLLSLRN